MAIVSIVTSVAITDNSHRQLGAVTNTAVAYVGTSTTLSVGPATTTAAFTLKTNCASRVISTKGQAILIGIGASSTPNLGFYQLASTTVAYPSNQYGCPAMNIYGVTASTTINIAEFLF